VLGAWTIQKLKFARVPDWVSGVIEYHELVKGLNMPEPNSTDLQLFPVN